MLSSRGLQSWPAVVAQLCQGAGRAGWAVDVLIKMPEARMPEAWMPQAWGSLLTMQLLIIQLLQSRLSGDSGPLKAIS